MAKVRQYKYSRNSRRNGKATEAGKINVILVVTVLEIISILLVYSGIYLLMKIYFTGTFVVNKKQARKTIWRIN